jgi:hypothetical protein
MSTPCSPSDIFAKAKCFDCGPIHREQMGIQIYILAQLAIQIGVLTQAQTTASALASQSNCFSCLTQKQLMAIQTYLICQITGA